MPVVFQAALDGSEAVRLFHVPIAGFYLRTALDHAADAATPKDSDERTRKSAIAIAFAAMAIEAFINERAEEILSANEIKRFSRLRKEFHPQPGESGMTAKLRTLSHRKYTAQMPTSLAEEVDALVVLRNMLVHYTPSDTAGKYFYPPVKPQPLAGGGAMVSISFIRKPLRIDPPFIQKVSPAAAVRAYNTARGVFHFWLERVGEVNPLKSFPELLPPSDR